MTNNTRITTNKYKTIMKQIIFFLLCIFSTITIQAQSSTVPDEVVFYDITSGAPFTYNKTIQKSGHIENFSCPFAYDVKVKDNNLEFSITNEDFKWYIVRKYPEKYVDFIINFYDGISHIGCSWPKPGHEDFYLPQAFSYTIRITF